MSHSTTSTVSSTKLLTLGFVLLMVNSRGRKGLWGPSRCKVQLTSIGYWCVYRMDIHESKERNELTATFELPGMKKDNVSIDIQNNRLTVSGRSALSNDLGREGYSVQERRYGSFSRTIPVPPGTKVRFDCLLNPMATYISIFSLRTLRPTWSTGSLRSNSRPSLNKLQKGSALPRVLGWCWENL